jgi:hypothetical protein
MALKLEHFKNRNLGLCPIKLTERWQKGIFRLDPQLPIAPYNLQLAEHRNKKASSIPVMVTAIQVGCKSELLSTHPIPLHLVDHWNLEQFDQPRLDPVIVEVEVFRRKMPRGGVIWVFGLVQCRIAMESND